jgi:predicted nucleic acid-binding protein
MADRLVIDTGPLIALAEADALDIIGNLPIEIVAPDEVRRELDTGVSSGHPIVDMSSIRIVSPPQTPSRIAVSNLGAGESAVIQLALDLDIDWVAIDERKGRRAALAVGLRVTGSLGLLGRAKRLGLIQSVKPFIEKLRQRGEWFDEDLLKRFLAGLDE